MFAARESSEVRFTIFIPLFAKDGSYCPEVLKWAISEIEKCIRGATVKAQSHGFWLDDEGKLCQDIIIPVESDTVDTLEIDIWFQELALSVGRKLNHSMVFLTKERVFIIAQNIEMN